MGVCYAQASHKLSGSIDPPIADSKATQITGMQTQHVTSLSTIVGKGWEKLLCLRVRAVSDALGSIPSTIQTTTNLKKIINKITMICYDVNFVITI